MIVDPLVPDHDAERFWHALDLDRARLARLLVRVFLTCAWHQRSADEVNPWASAPHDDERQSTPCRLWAPGPFFGGGT
jgi:hypothetical protein